MKKDLAQFDYRVMARLDSEMWRAYYQHRFLKLFRLLYKLFRTQFSPNMLVTFRLAYYAAVAATDYRVKKGHENHARVLRNLVRFYRTISSNSTRPFDYQLAAEMELEWWDIRRYPDKYDSTLELSLAKNMAAVYSVDVNRLRTYAHYRAEAMLLRDQQGDIQKIEPSWEKIEDLLMHSWKSLQETVKGIR